MMLEDKLKKMIIEKFGSIRQFSIKYNIPNTTIDSILKRGIDNSNVLNVNKICKALNISLDSLIDNKEIVSLLNFDNASYSTDKLTYSIPVFGTIIAGTPIEAQQNILEYIDIPIEMTKGGKKFYGLKIKGDSMYPKYVENDIVIFEEVDDYMKANKKDCAVMVNGYDATFKNVTINGDSITLTPLNPLNHDGYVPTTYTKEQIINLPVKIMGIAIEKRTKL